MVLWLVVAVVQVVIVVVWLVVAVVRVVVVAVWLVVTVVWLVVMVEWLMVTVEWLIVTAGGRDGVAVGCGAAAPLCKACMRRRQDHENRPNRCRL
jgi:presenilin-like A22 family membrane protease